MTVGQLYVAAPTQCHAIDTRTVFLMWAGSSHPTPARSTVPFVLGLCFCPRTLAEHERVIAASAPQLDGAAIRSLLAALVADGLLTPVAARHTNDLQAMPVETIAILTSDPPNQLRRCLASILDQGNRTNPMRRILVIDDSHSPSSAQRNRETLAAAARGSHQRIDYVGHRECAALREHLRRSGADPRHLDVLLHEGPLERTVPTLRWNAALLFTAGQRVWIVDDSVICVAWGSANNEPVVIAGHSEARRYELFETRADALDVPPLTGADVIRECESAFGISLAGLRHGGRAFEYGGACGHMLRLLNVEAATQVRIVVPGIAGDVGPWCPYLLLTKASVAEQLSGNDTVLDRALLFREMRCAPRQVVVTHDLTWGWTSAVALDNTVELPPFPPVGRDADVAFGALTSIVDPTALAAYLPIGVLNDSARPSHYDSADVRCSEPTFAALVVAALADFGISRHISSVGDRLTCVGHHIIESCRRPREEWRWWLRAAFVAQCAQKLSATDVEKTPVSNYSTSYKASLSRYRSALLSQIASDDCEVPPEFRRRFGPRADEELQRAMQTYGEAIVQWPEIWAHAKVASKLTMTSVTGTQA